MSEVEEMKVLEKIEQLEYLLVEINNKIENFMSYEDLTSEEEEEKVEKIIKEMKNRKYVRF